MDEEKKLLEYEIAYLVTREEDAPAVMKLVQQHSGRMTRDFGLRKITFAYKVRKEASGYFGAFRFEAQPQDAKAMEHDLKTEKAVLRSLIIRTTPLREKESVSVPLAARVAEKKPVQVLSNEALEKKIEEILQ